MSLLKNPESFYGTLVVSSVSECIKSTSPAIADIVNLCGKDKGGLIVRAMLVIAIGNLNNYFNIGNPMNSPQTIETIDLICKRFTHYKMDDFKLCFDKMKMGYYGKTYNRIDGQILFEALNAYDIERLETAENLNHIRHEELKKGKIDYKDANKEGQKKVTEILKSVLDSNDKVVKPESNKVLKRGQSKEDAFAQSVLREFDHLYETQNKGKEKLGTKFIMIDHVGYSASEYLDLRVREFSNHI